MKSITNALLAGLAFITTPVSAIAQDEILINQIQILGSHNSYRPYPDAATLATIRTVYPDETEKLEYGHPPIEDQLALGVRQFEFDPISDESGARFAAPYASDPRALAIMSTPGAKVLHIPPFDYRTHCLTLELCLKIIADWSVAHSDHELIFILINNRDAPEPYTAAGLDAVDATIRSTFGIDRIIAPDSVRGDHETLREAAMNRAWASTLAARGKVLLVHATSPRLNAMYADGHPSLRGRMMFGLYPEDAAEAAIFHVQDPVAKGDTIRCLVGQGFLVWTRADANTVEARTHDLSRLNAAAESGAQIISTDYYPGTPDPLELGFEVRLDDGFSQANSLAAMARDLDEEDNLLCSSGL